MKKLSRRAFLYNTSMASVAIGVVPATTDPLAKKEIFVHHVFFWLKNPDSAADRDKLVEGLKKLTKIQGLRKYYIGYPAGTSRGVIDSSYAVSWLTFFDNPEAEEVYQKHPVHLKFIEDYGHLWEKVIVYDSVGPRT